MTKRIAFSKEQHAIAIFAAKVYGDAEMEAALWRAEKNIYAINFVPYGGNVLHMAATRGYNQLVKILLDVGVYIDSRGRGFYNCTPLVSVVHRNIDLSETILLLLDRGANIEATMGESAFTSLMIAAFMGNTTNIRILLDHGADIEAKNKFGETALMVAVKHGKIDSAKVLLEHGANPHAKNHQGCSPFMRAALNDKKDFIALFLNYQQESVVG
jgi:ankyrin repeat protein